MAASDPRGDPPPAAARTGGTGRQGDPPTARPGNTPAARPGDPPAARPGDPPAAGRPASRHAIPAPPPPTRGSDPGPATGRASSATPRSSTGRSRGGLGSRLRATAAAGPSRINRILPRTALGISIAVLSFSLGASLSGVVLYSYYEYRLTQTQDKISRLSGGISQTAKKAQDQLQAEEDKAQALISRQIAPLKSILATGQTLQAIAAKVAPALYFVHTLDSAGQPSVGTAFAVASDTHQTLLLTSYTVVQAATRKPGPPLYVRHENTDQQVTVYTWEETKDLALIILPAGNQPKIAFATSSPQPGERVFAASALGAAGASITQGFVADVSAEGIQHDARTGTQFQGGPLLDSDSKVVGILSRTYSPLGFGVADVYFAVPPAAACEKVLQCPGGTPAATGSSGATNP